MPFCFALIKERKSPPDRRVVFSPKMCQKVMEMYPETKILVESSDVRFFKDEEYVKAGIEVVKDVSKCDYFLGVKEVPVEALIPHKKYFFFSHTIKHQPYNRELLRAILEKKIELYDHETIVDERGHRLIGFGRYAGLVGAYNAFRALGLRVKIFELPKVETLHDLNEMKEELDKVSVPPIKIVLTGKGKVARGAKEILEHLHVKKVSVHQYLTEEFNEPVYCMIHVSQYNKRIDGTEFNKQDFYENPERYDSNFLRFAKVSNMFIAGHFYGEHAPIFFTKKDAMQRDFKINVVADISCDINGPIASTIRSSTIKDPFYGYDPVTGKEVPFDRPGAITVMAVDNLPCELPKDSSEGFGKKFLDKVFPSFFNGDKEGILERAKMTTSRGNLTKRYKYLLDFVGESD
jgi:alanine dehydrogenase